jgi:L-ribulokinase
MQKDQKYVIGLDYGTDSVRCVVVDAADGEQQSSSVFHYPRWKAGQYCNPSINQFRQHPLDYLEGLEASVKDALSLCGKGVAEKVVGLSVDTTGSTPVAVDSNGSPLSMLPEFANNPNAMFVLWKDHTAIHEAEEINHLARTWGGADFTKYEGGIYSSEWFWAKVLHLMRADEAVRKAAFSWVEHCDWIPALLTGQTNPLSIKRSRCAAGHKAMWHEDFGGLPDEAFLENLDPLLSGLRNRLYKETQTADMPIGTLSEEWAERLGLPASAVVGTGTFDAHAGAVGGEIEPYTLSKVMGTSTCDMLVAPDKNAQTKLVRGICGQVDGSIIPGMLGLEAGQSAFGDIYAWFKNMILSPAADEIQGSSIIDQITKDALIEQLSERMLSKLTDEASKIPIGKTGLLSVDWMNGRRTPDANQALRGAILGLNLGSNAAGIFRSLVEATCFGSKRIVDRFMDEGIEIRQVVALGGVAKKSPFVMQMMADVLNMPIKVAYSEQTPALGAAMFAATASGIYQKVELAQKAMGSGFDRTYEPAPENVAKYHALYQKYLAAGTFIEQQTKD